MYMGQWRPGRDRAADPEKADSDCECVRPCGKSLGVAMIVASILWTIGGVGADQEHLDRDSRETPRGRRL